jgi:hypothetical protein
VNVYSLTGSISEAVAYLIADMDLHPGDLYATSMMDSTEKMEIGTDPEHSTQSSGVRKLQGECKYRSTIVGLCGATKKV